MNARTWMKILVWLPFTIFVIFKAWTVYHVAQGTEHDSFQARLMPDLLAGAFFILAILAEARLFQRIRWALIVIVYLIGIATTCWDAMSGGHAALMRGFERRRASIRL